MKQVFVDDQPLEFEAGLTVLEFLQKQNWQIPTLCWLKELNGGNCRLCLVEIEENQIRTLQASCVYPLRAGQKIYPHSPKVLQARQQVLQLLLAEHEKKCLSCPRNLSCELQSLAAQMNIRTIPELEKPSLPPRQVNSFIQRDYGKCIRCRRCLAICREIQQIGVYSALNRGLETLIAPAYALDLSEVRCIACGQCVQHCPTASLTEREYLTEVEAALADPQVTVVVQTAPAIGVSLAEALGEKQARPGQLPAALRKLGFNYVFSTAFAADLTTVEETKEFLQRLDKGENLPLFTSCSPGWVNFCRTFYPELTPHLSSCKSPMTMLGALSKHYWAAQLDLHQVKVFAIMPCTAKKLEATRSLTEQEKDVDGVLTTRELAKLIRKAGLAWNNIPEEEFDQPLGWGSSSGYLFAASGGVTEAVLRQAAAFLGMEKLPEKSLKPLRETAGIRELELELGGRPIKAAIVHGTANAHQILQQIKHGKKYDFLEIMACPGGCIGGGGQPIVPAEPTFARVSRAEKLYQEDEQAACRVAWDTPAVQKLYRDFLGEPLSSKAKALLHNQHRIN
ncbi:MAG: [FeFe] hydrogenase, group A [Clostridia bacterium]|nr:[FeFe] hydrogenase, group A [Clostridia bacterium]